MLAMIHKARDRIVQKLETIQHPKPGMFLTPPEELLHKSGIVSSASLSSLPDALGKLDEESVKFLESQNENNNLQLKFFLKAHERQDANLKKKIQYSLICLSKREQIDRQ